ncbi:hypothetical protein L6164_026302 [Bauhinia variegata]|uniref:Uncharacterized protein n=1 Tax=Bauhinia variegata TaxID=167791 RepID=A0ACB9LQ12_BAUVA|nr:hypothetical protein L6164_026302 [Bauhinia variegata]
MSDAVKAIFPAHPIEEVSNFEPKNILTNRKYYELDLLDTNSVEITHNESPNGSSDSKMKIKRLSHKTWAHNPDTAKKINRKFQGIGITLITKMFFTFHCMTKITIVLGSYGLAKIVQKTFQTGLRTGSRFLDQYKKIPPKNP